MVVAIAFVTHGYFPRWLVSFKPKLVGEANIEVTK